MKEKLPVYSDNKIKGNHAADQLKRVLSNFSIVNVIDESGDLGIDMRAELIENNHPTGLFFNIQCKGKAGIDSLTQRHGYFSIPIKVTTINYWKIQNDVTFLFVVNNSNGNCYWCNPLEQIKNRNKPVQNQDEVSIKVILNDYINYNSKECPSSIRNDILLYMADQFEKTQERLLNIRNAVNDGSGIDSRTSIELLKRIAVKANKTTEIYNEICTSLIKNIREHFSEAYEYARELEYCDPGIVKKYCKNGVLKDKGFSSTQKSLEEFREEIDKLLNKYEDSNEAIDILDRLNELHYEVMELLKNMGAFLYEMVCEDDPFADHTELYNKIWGELLPRMI